MSGDEVGVDCCAPGTGCQSTRWRDRVQTRLDNSTFHHRWIANGPLWWLCPPCRSLRRALGERSELTLEECRTCGAAWTGRIGSRLDRAKP